MEYGIDANLDKFLFFLLFVIASTAMPKTTTFKYVSSKSSGSSFSPTSTENLDSSSPSPTSTIFSSTPYTERIERRHVNYNGMKYRTGWMMDATDSQPHEAFFYVELLCNIWFIVEFTTRFLVIIVYVKINAI